MWLWIFASAAEAAGAPARPLGGRAVRPAARGLGPDLDGRPARQPLRLPAPARPATLRVRYGASHSITLPWDAVASLTHRRQDLDSSVWTLQPRETESGVDLRGCLRAGQRACAPRRPTGGHDREGADGGRRAELLRRRPLGPGLARPRIIALAPTGMPGPLRAEPAGLASDLPDDERAADPGWCRCGCGPDGDPEDDVPSAQPLKVFSTL